MRKTHIYILWKDEEKCIQYLRGWICNFLVTIGKRLKTLGRGTKRSLRKG